jgi:hypothetical protein
MTALAPPPNYEQRDPDRKAIRIFGSRTADQFSAAWLWFDNWLLLLPCAAVPVAMSAALLRAAVGAAASAAAGLYVLQLRGLTEGYGCEGEHQRKIRDCTFHLNLLYVELRFTKRASRVKTLAAHRLLKRKELSKSETHGRGCGAAGRMQQDHWAKEQRTL